MTQDVHTRQAGGRTANAQRADEWGNKSTKNTQFKLPSNPLEVILAETRTKANCLIYVVRIG